MTFWDWCIFFLPLMAVMGIGIYCRKYITSVVGFLAAGRVAGRFVLSVSSVTDGAMGVIILVGFIEAHYKTGFAINFWNNLRLPVSLLLGLAGFVIYRYREMKVLSFGQFIEMRYSKSLRILAAVLRATAEIMASMLAPALAARFFIYLFGFPDTFTLFGLAFDTYTTIIFIVICLALTLILCGGILGLMVTDCIQGLILYPCMFIMVIFICSKFSWFKEMAPVMLDRGPGESFLNPYDVEKLKDFNLFNFFVVTAGMVLHGASWVGGGSASAAKSAHEQKMAGLLGRWSGGLFWMFAILLSIMIVTFFNHIDFADDAKIVRDNISNEVIGEILKDEFARKNVSDTGKSVKKAPAAGEGAADSSAKITRTQPAPGTAAGSTQNVQAEVSEKPAVPKGKKNSLRKEFADAIAAVPAQRHVIGKDPPLTDKVNLDTPHIAAVEKVMEDRGIGKEKAQEFTTLYHQLMLPFTLRHMLPAGLMGLFALMMVLMMLSTDDTRIYCSGTTIAQDIILPLLKKAPTPKQHLLLIRVCCVFVGVCFFFGSVYMKQLDYINLFIAIVCSIWTGGCAPVMLGGMYCKYGNTFGAYCSLVSGMFISLGGMLTQRYWASHIYPFLERNDYVEAVGEFLEKVSRPMNPIIVWEMNPKKFPINSIEIYALAMIVSLTLYVIGSFLTYKGPFNMDKMLHRGIYNVDNEPKPKTEWKLSVIFRNLVGINSQYTKFDKFIAYFTFYYSFVFSFFIGFVVVFFWNLFESWKPIAWSWYFFLYTLVVPGTLAFFSTFLFTIGGWKDLIQLFRDLKAGAGKTDDSDNGMVVKEEESKP